MESIRLTTVHSWYHSTVWWPTYFLKQEFNVWTDLYKETQVDILWCRLLSMLLSFEAVIDINTLKSEKGNSSKVDSSLHFWQNDVQNIIRFANATFQPTILVFRFREGPKDRVLKRWTGTSCNVASLWHCLFWIFERWEENWKYTRKFAFK